MYIKDIVQQLRRPMKIHWSPYDRHFQYPPTPHQAQQKIKEKVNFEKEKESPL